MGCNCKDNREHITQGLSDIAELRELFIKRMTVNSDHSGRRRKDYNQAIFGWWSEDKAEADPAKTFPVWSNMSMDMVLKCFDDATQDWRKTFCDVENCNRKP